MKFPSKVTPYKESIISLFPVILSLLEKREMSPKELYASLKKSKGVRVQEFMDILDCLYTLNIVELREEVLFYVGSNTM